ncbi:MULTISPECIES: DNA polymerase III subunit chi [Halomonas]|uniref:DNA polymerase III subunit chi n=1 Tax=Halomonas halophila TaxID=29573 RepID=A0ABQ0U3A7_9GAMM|nr:MULTISPECIES: DNA polymerase III subunit chi [Halomonas]PSJ22294.1 DNA polymerase III subunit chi [Halomonas sp. ND22Bw]MDR5888511.1 DNA polymerase III subunit chi [Halomonas salina]QFT83707.1 DNA polymerase III subunit chi [Halomonas sp. THAF12]WJY07694.1 DNA polymerase III subunit chi [Halomonas halophila]GEK73021.1 DNA polymerase III subunit chi [Halomonas halophila]
MTRIDFYILPETTLEARLAFACRLAETIARKGYRLHLHAEDEAMARELDDTLWTFRPDAYLPHALLGSEQADSVPVTLGWQEPPPGDAGVQAMLNLHPEIPEWFSRFERVAEIINQHQAVLTAKRRCWQTYKKRGYPVTPHHLRAGA